jgi:hypothetical protein
LREAGFDLESYEFGPRDLFVQAVMVAVRRPEVVARAPRRAAATA